MIAFENSTKYIRAKHTRIDARRVLVFIQRNKTMTLDTLFYYLGAVVFVGNVLLMVAYACSVLLTVRAGVQPKKPYHNVSHQTVYILAYALLKPILEYIKGSDAREIAQYKDIFDAMLDTVFRRNAPIQDRRRTVPEVSIPTIERRRKAMVPAA